MATVLPVTAVADADRAKAAEVLWPFGTPIRLSRDGRVQRDRIAVALAEARAPYDRLTADLRALAEELQGLARDNYPVTARAYTDAAARLLAVIAAVEGAKA